MLFEKQEVYRIAANVIGAYQIEQKELSMGIVHELANAQTSLSSAVSSRPMLSTGMTRKYQK